MQKSIHAQTVEHYTILQELMRDQQKDEARQYLQTLKRSYPAASLLEEPLTAWCRGDYTMEASGIGVILQRGRGLSSEEKTRLEELFVADKAPCVFVVIDRFLPDRHYKLAEGISCITVDGSPREDFLSCLVHELAHAVFDAGNRLLNEGMAVYFERRVRGLSSENGSDLPVNLLSLLDTPLPYVEFHDLFPELGESYYQAAGDLMTDILDKSGTLQPAAFLRKWEKVPGDLPSERLAGLVDLALLPLRSSDAWQRSSNWLDERLKTRDFFRDPKQAAEQYLAWANRLSADDLPEQRDLSLVLMLMALASRSQLSRLQLDAIKVQATAFHRRLDLYEEDRSFVQLLGALLRIHEAMDSRSPTQKRKKMEQANADLEALSSHAKWGSEARRVLQHSSRRPTEQKGNTMNRSGPLPSAAETLLQTGVAKQLADYAGINAQIYDYRHVMAHDINFYLKHLPPRSRILELGCGTGRVTKPLVEYGMLVTGVDLSRDMLALCRERLRGLDAHSYRLIQGDMTSVVTEESYDAIIIPYSSFSLLENHQKRLQTLNHIKGMLNPGGTIYIDYEAPDPYVQVSPLGITHVSAFPSEQGAWMEVWLVKHDPIRNMKMQEISNFSLSKDGTYEVYVTKTAESYLSPSEVKLLVEQAGFKEKACVRSYGLDPRSDFMIGNRFMTSCG